MTAPQKYNFGISKTVLIRHACAKTGHSWTTALQPDDAVVATSLFHQREEGSMDDLRLATPPSSPVPISDTALLLGSDLLNITGFRRKFAAKKDFIFLKTKPSHSLAMSPPHGNRR
jgi:hypothetical protein